MFDVFRKKVINFIQEDYNDEEDEGWEAGLLQFGSNPTDLEERKK
jgi:hypothetical protein